MLPFGKQQDILDYQFDDKSRRAAGNRLPREVTSETERGLETTRASMRVYDNVAPPLVYQVGDSSTHSETPLLNYVIAAHKRSMQVSPTLLNITSIIS